jgi:hypothetical protein
MAAKLAGRTAKETVVQHRNVVVAGRKALDDELRLLVMLPSCPHRPSTASILPSTSSALPWARRQALRRRTADVRDCPGALMSRPTLLMLDEPFVALSP